MTLLSYPRRLHERRRPGVTRLCFFVFSWSWVEAAAERKVQVHALHAPFALHAKQRCSRRVQRNALLQDGAQIARSDIEAHLRQFHRAGVACDGTRKNDFSLVGGVMWNVRPFIVPPGSITFPYLIE